MMNNQVPSERNFFFLYVLIAVLIFLGCLFPAQASVEKENEKEKEKVVQWMERAVSAARDLDYRGVVAYFQQDRVETSKLIHLADPSGGYQYMESMNGPRREIVIKDNELRCYLPDEQSVLSVPYTQRAATFPIPFHSEIIPMLDNYRFEIKNETVHVAGRDAQIAVFKPKDKLRYEYIFWTDRETGLILVAHLLDQNKKLIERFEFVKIEIGSEALEKNLATWPEVPGNWRIDRIATHSINPVAPVGWAVKTLPNGFRQVAEEQRLFQGRTLPTDVLVFSDGLVAITVFIEEDGGFVNNDLTHSDIDLGYFNAHSYKKDGFWITAIGRVPHDTLRLLAQSIVRK